MSARGPTCREVVELVSEYLEDALPAEDRRRVEEHLAGCEGCSRYLDQMRETIRLTGMLSEEHLSEEQRTALTEAFRTWSGR